MHSFQRHFTVLLASETPIHVFAYSVFEGTHETFLRDLSAASGGTYGIIP